MPGATLTPESNGNNLSDNQVSEDSTRPSDPTTSAHAKLKENEVASVNGKSASDGTAAGSNSTSSPEENGKESTHSHVILIFL